VGNVQKLYYKWPLIARPIAKINGLVCSYFVFIISDDVLVRIVRAQITNELLKFVHLIIVIFIDRCAFVPIPGFSLQLACSPCNVVLRRVLRLYQPDQPFGPLDKVFLFIAHQRVKSPVVLFSILLFISIGNVLIALMYVLGQLLKMFISSGSLLFVPCFLLCAPSVAVTIEDELIVGADLLFLEGDEFCVSGIGVRMVLGMTSNK
jgi:hypothetical protein